VCIPVSMPSICVCVCVPSMCVCVCVCMRVQVSCVCICWHTHDAQHRPSYTHNIHASGPNHLPLLPPYPLPTQTQTHTLIAHKQLVVGWGMPSIGLIAADRESVTRNEDTHTQTHTHTQRNTHLPGCGGACPAPG